MAALESRPVSSSVNGDVDVSLDVPADMTEEDVIDEEDIQKEVRTIHAILRTGGRRGRGAAHSAMFLATASCVFVCIVVGNRADD